MVEDWTSGYVADLGYTYGYYAELNPMSAEFSLLSAGVRPPGQGVACELGFGQGMSVNVHAAASGAQWWGTDFNPAQAGFAQELAAASESGAHLFDESFAEFCRRPDLPEMDYIGLHGIWSWISDENRAVIVDFVRRKLRVGGVLYISYNTQPGWASAAPLRDLLAGHAEVMGSTGQGLISRIDASIAFAQKLLDTHPAYAKANPLIAERLKKIATQDRNYVAHEYFNRDWEPMSFAKMAEWLAPAKVNYASSANFFDHVETLNLTPQQQALLKDIPDPMFRQTVRDFCVNQQFRKDFWVKGARSMSSLEQAEALRDYRIVLIARASEIKLKVSGAQAEGNLNEAVYAPILEALADNKPRSLRELSELVKPKGVKFPAMLQAVIVLTGKGAVQPVQLPEKIASARPFTDKLNRRLMMSARSTAEISYLASPVTGGGVPVSRFQQMFLLALTRGEQDPREWVRGTWQDLARQGQRLVKDGKTLDTPEENIAELTRQAEDFKEKRLSVLRALEVV